MQTKYFDTLPPWPRHFDSYIQACKQHTPSGFEIDELLLEAQKNNIGTKKLTFEVLEMESSFAPAK
jgi:hypothetical protein